MNDTIAQPGAKPGESTLGQPLIAAHNIYKTYRMGRVDVPVLRGASLEVNPGEWVAVLGASGSGKSTLLHLMGDLDQPDPTGRDARYQGRAMHAIEWSRYRSGRCPNCGHILMRTQSHCPECGQEQPITDRPPGLITFHARALNDLSLRERNHYRNRSVGFVFQFYHLLPELNVLENTYLPAMVGHHRFAWYRARGEIRKRATELLKSFGLDHRLKHRPRELSGGERQRVAIARALINQPEVLLADEPTGNLDEHTGREILDLLAAQHRAGLTIVMVTHDASIAERADRVVQLHHGQVE